MTQKIISALIHGLEARTIEVEVDISPGMPAFTIVGLGDAAIQESKERIRSAIKNSGAQYPQQKKIINLAPAHFRKSGPSLDLPMAIGLLAQSNQIMIPSHAIFIGELALDGTVRGVHGSFSIALLAKKNGYNKIYLPHENANEASMVDQIEIFGVSSLKQLVSHLKGELVITPFVKKQASSAKQLHPEVDFSQIHGQNHAKRGLEIAAAGHHNLLFYGPPGVGKTMLAKALSGILPGLSQEQHAALIQIYSCAGMLQAHQIDQRLRPFREVHHTASKIALLGGGANLKPGEITFAHHGVLFLDEIAEFPHTHIEGLRQPLEEKCIILARSGGTETYPANFMLVAAMNPCRCGFYGDPQKKCLCTTTEIINYNKKISGPILDRIDITIELARQNFNNLHNNPTPEDSETVQKRVQQAIHFQQKSRHQMKSNSLLKPKELKTFCALDSTGQKLLQAAAEKLYLSSRSYDHILKVARTIADLAHEEKIKSEHIAESLQYRSKVLI